MEWYLKALIAIAIAVPVSVEMRTFGGMFGLSIPLYAYIVGGVLVAFLIVAADELWLSGSESIQEDRN